MESFKEQLKSAVVRVMEKKPLLGFHGFETGERELMTSDEGLIQFQIACEWIDRQNRLDKIKDHATSYTFKHLVERDVGRYMANGMWICAAIHLGLRYRRYRKYHDIICNLPCPKDCIRLSEGEYLEMKASYQNAWPGIDFNR